MAEVSITIADLQQLVGQPPRVQVSVDVTNSEAEEDRPATLALIYALTVHRLVKSGRMNALSRQVCADLYPRQSAGAGRSHRLI